MTELVVMDDDGQRNPPSTCAPVRYRKSRQSCLTRSDVVQVASALGATADVLGAPINRLRAWVNARLETAHESEWPDHPLLAGSGLSSKLSQAFRPKHPETWLHSPRTWLSNYDIDAVMRQYNDAYPKFRFVGVFPSDFSSPKPYSYDQCVSAKMCNLSVSGLLSQGVDHVGIVFNLDKHTGSGTHWTSLYVGLDPSVPDRFGAWYYDSTARAPLKEMAEFMARMKREAMDAGIASDSNPFPIWHNRRRKQFKNTECGVYAMFFLVACISTSYSIPLISQCIMQDDDKTHRLRTVFFRRPNAWQGGSDIARRGNKKFGESKSINPSYHKQ